MSRTEETATIRSGSAAVAERWADLTKAIAIYPETNSRVAASVACFLDALHDYLDEADSEQAEILFTRERFIVGEEVFDLESVPALGWIRRHLDLMGLAGVCFGRSTNSESLCDLGLRLIAAGKAEGATGPPGPEEGEELEGIVLVRRQFTGTFASAGPRSETSITRTWAAGVRGEGASGLGELAAALAEDSGISEALLGIGELIAAEPDEDDAQRVDLLSNIVAQLPVEVMQDMSSVVSVTKDVLKHLRQRLEGGSREDGFGLLDDQVALGSLMFVMSRRFFSREGRDAAALVEDAPVGPPAGEAPAPKMSGRAGDDAISESFDDFKRELAALPEAEIDLGGVDTERPEEQLGACLHYLVNSDSHDEKASLGSLLRRLLTEPDEDRLALLRLYLDHLTESEGGGERVAAVISFLVGLQLAPVLKACGFLDLRAMQKAFPTGFGLYLDTLDPESGSDGRDLDELCHSCAPRISDAVRQCLVEQEGILEPRRVAWLLSRPSPAIMPFARIILEEGGDRYERDVLRYLRSLGLKTREAVLLRIADGDAYLTREYLLGMVHPEIKRSLRSEIAAILARYVRETARVPQLLPRRIYAIKQFAEFRSTETESCLNDVLGGTRWLVFPVESKAARRAAREVLRSWNRI